MGIAAVLRRVTEGWEGENSSQSSSGSCPGVFNFSLSFVLLVGLGERLVALSFLLPFVLLVGGSSSPLSQLGFLFLRKLYGDCACVSPGFPRCRCTVAVIGIIRFLRPKCGEVLSPSLTLLFP